MKKILLAANWKMHPASLPLGEPSIPSRVNVYKGRKNVEVLVFPTFLDLSLCLKQGLKVGAQYGHPEDHGAHTGDVSMKMIKELGCSHVLCGHSERRQQHDEMDDDVAAQTLAALKHNLHPIICIGETEKERAAGREKEIVQRQVETVLRVINDANVTWAYEPVWAIGTGKTATPKDAEMMHAFIRSLLPSSKRETNRILYGGSMKPENAAALLNEPNIDGGLIGGASLKPEEFSAIVALA